MARYLKRDQILLRQSHCACRENTIIVQIAEWLLTWGTVFLWYAIELDLATEIYGILKQGRRVC